MRTHDEVARIKRLRSFRDVCETRIRLDHANLRNARLAFIRGELSRGEFNVARLDIELSIDQARKRMNGCTYVLSVWPN